MAGETRTRTSLNWSRAQCNFVQSDFTLFPPTLLYAKIFLNPPFEIIAKSCICITDTSIHNLAPKYFGRETRTRTSLNWSRAQCNFVQSDFTLFPPTLLYAKIFLNPPFEIIAKSCICITDTSIHNLAPKHFGRGDSLTHVCCFPSRDNIFTSGYLTHNSMDTPLLQLTYNIMNTPL